MKDKSTTPLFYNYANDWRNKLLHSIDIIFSVRLDIFVFRRVCVMVTQNFLKS